MSLHDHKRFHASLHIGRGDVSNASIEEQNQAIRERNATLHYHQMQGAMALDKHFHQLSSEQQKSFFQTLQPDVARQYHKLTREYGNLTPTLHISRIEDARPCEQGVEVFYPGENENGETIFQSKIFRIPPEKVQERAETIRQFARMYKETPPSISSAHARNSVLLKEPEAEIQELNADDINLDALETQLGLEHEGQER